MRIGVDFSHNFGHSGIGTYNRELVKAMAILDADVHFELLTQLRRGQFIERYCSDIENIRIAEIFPSKMMLGKSFKPIMNYIRSFLWKLSSEKYDVVHFTDPVFFCGGLHNAVTTVHDIIPLYNSDYSNIRREKIKKYKIDLIVRDSKRIVVPTHYVKNELLRYFPESEGRVVVIYEGSKKIFKVIDVDDHIIRKYDVDPEKLFYLFVGRIEERKNIDNILISFKILPEFIRRDANLVLISNGSDKEVCDLKEKILKLGLQKSVYLLQGVPDDHLVHFYNAALALIFVSFSEGFGLPLVEALNCGCPSIISNVSSLPEVAGGSALMVDPFRVDQICDAMRNIYEDSVLREGMISKGIEISKRYSWHSAAYETLELYKKVGG